MNKIYNDKRNKILNIVCSPEKFKLHFDSIILPYTFNGKINTFFTERILKDIADDFNVILNETVLVKFFSSSFWFDFIKKSSYFTEEYYNCAVYLYKCIILSLMKFYNQIN